MADVACYGELLWDFFEAEAKPDKEPIARQFRREPGGASANVAIALARLGVDAAVVGAVGKDKLGEAMFATLAAERVDTSSLSRVEGRTPISFVLRDALGQPTFMPYRQGPLEMAKIPAGAAKARFLVLGTSALLPAERETTEKILAAAEKAKAAIVVDLNVRLHMWPDAESLRSAAKELASRAAIVKGSESDLDAVAGKRGLTWLEANANGATWILTRGENGAAALGPHGQVTAPTKRVRCIDATGAGDAFLAGVLAVLVRAGAKPGSKEWKDAKLWSRALEVAHLLAAKAVSAAGATAGLVQLDDLKTKVGPAKK